MAKAPDRILAIDIGATMIKFAPIDGCGVLTGEVQKIPTPYPCAPTRLIEVVTCVIREGDWTSIGVGFPGEFVDGIVLEPGNLARPSGISSPTDPALEVAWRGFRLEEELRAVSGRDVRVVNDATLAALGCHEGVGRELVFTLGTGFGIALVVDGGPQRIRDVGGEVFVEGRTFDQVLGEGSRAADQHTWTQRLVLATKVFTHEYYTKIVHFGGGNARHVDVAYFVGLDCRVTVNDNDASLRGAARLFA